MEQLKEDDLAVLRGGRRDATSVIRQQSLKIFRLSCYAPAMYRAESVPPPFPPPPPPLCRRIGECRRAPGGRVADNRFASCQIVLGRGGKFITEDVQTLTL